VDRGLFREQEKVYVQCSKKRIAVGLVEDLIELRRQQAAAGEAGTSIRQAIARSATRRSKSKRWHVPELYRRYLIARQKHLDRSGKRLNESYWPRRRKKILQRLAESYALAVRKRRATRGYVSVPVAPWGTVSPNAQWVALVALMEPGRWYGIRVLEQLVGRRKPVNWGCQWATRVFLDRGLNPKYQPLTKAQRNIQIHGCGYLTPEPKILWRLNRWGVALREAVLDNLTGERIDLLKLDGADREKWQAASSKRRKSRGGLSQGS
jgi:hypothetical protein